MDENNDDDDDDYDELIKFLPPSQRRPEADDLKVIIYITFFLL